MTGDNTIRPLHVPPLASVEVAADELTAALHLIPAAATGSWDQALARYLTEDGDPATVATIADWLRRVYAVGRADGASMQTTDLRREREAVRNLAEALRAVEQVTDLAASEDGDPARILRDLVRRLDAITSGQAGR